MGQTLQMKMAKASKEDLDQVRQFFDMLEEVIEYGTFTKPDDDSEDISDEQFVSLIRKAWNTRGEGVGTAWRRVVYGCDILIDNCCDPAADTLEWRPDIAAMMEAQGE